jgi:hypothetical protein
MRRKDYGTAAVMFFARPYEVPMAVSLSELMRRQSARSAATGSIRMQLDSSIFFALVYFTAGAIPDRPRAKQRAWPTPPP